MNNATLLYTASVPASIPYMAAATNTVYFVRDAAILTAWVTKKAYEGGVIAIAYFWAAAQITYGIGQHFGEFYYSNGGKERIAAEMAPTVAAGKETVAWVFGIDRLWSAQNLPLVVEANRVFMAEVVGDYRAVGDRANSFVESYLLG